MNHYQAHHDIVADLATAQRERDDARSDAAYWRARAEAQQRIIDELRARIKRMEAMQPESMSRRGEGVMSPQVDDARLLGPWSDKDRADLRRVLLSERGKLWGELREVAVESWRAVAITHRLREIARLLEGMGGDRRGQVGSNPDPKSGPKDP